MTFAVNFIVKIMSNAVIATCVSEIKKRKLIRSNVKWTKLLGSKNPKGYMRPPLIHLNAQYCPPDLLHLTKGVILKQIEQVTCKLLTQQYKYSQ